MTSATNPQIEKFNKMYKLPLAKLPTTKELGVPLVQRLESLKVILNKEVAELDDIILKAKAYSDGGYYVKKDGDFPRSIDELEVLTDVADLLVDLQVYAQSEMLKFGLPNGTVFALVMNSNFSKLGADGQPIYDEHGKVQKGPGYWKPEPQIRNLLSALQSGGTHVIDDQRSGLERRGLGNDQAAEQAVDKAA